MEKQMQVRNKTVKKKFNHLVMNERKFEIVELNGSIYIKYSN